MGWFDEQIRLRKESDQNVFEESMFNMASAVLGKRDSRVIRDERILTRNAIDEILKYYHYKPVDIPDNIRDPEEQLEYCLRPYGLMPRNVRLTEGWYEDACGPMLASYKEDDRPVVLLPRPFRGYWYKDSGTGEKGRVNKKNAATINEEAICFYRPLPMRSIGISDLIIYLRNCLDFSDFVMLFALTLIATLVGMLMPRLTLLLTGTVLERGSKSLLLGTAVFMVCVLVSSQMITTIRTLVLGRIDVKTSMPVEAAMIMRVLSLPTGFFRQYSSGELASRVSKVNQLCSLLLSSLFSMGLTSLMSLLYITQIFQFAPALVVPSVVIILLTTGLTVGTSLLQMKISRQTMEIGAKENGISIAMITGVQKIKLAGAEKRAFARWADTYAKEAKLMYDPPLLIKTSGVILAGISLAGTIVLYFLAVKSHVTPSEYIAFNSAYGMVTGAFTSLANVGLSIANIRPILEMIKPLLVTAPETEEGGEAVTSLAGGVELNNIHFRYSEKNPYVLRGLNLKIRPGEYVAIVGSTGCGKSTLMRLLLGFEKAEKGAIYYDGKDMSHLDLRSLRKKIGAVIQNGTLFQGDIYSNIVISAPQLGMDDAWEAAEIAGIANDIKEMPMGMQTIISEGQGGISGGQKQRLMIARAVAPKPKILMLDEATSALDNKTQKQVSEALDRLKCTRIVIAHRLSTIRNCDRIVLLDKGKIVEDGTYDELLQMGGGFAQLVERQRLDFVDNG